VRRLKIYRCILTFILDRRRPEFGLLLQWTRRLHESDWRPAALYSITLQMGAIFPPVRLSSGVVNRVRPSQPVDNTHLPRSSRARDHGCRSVMIVVDRRSAFGGARSRSLTTRRYSRFLRDSHSTTCSSRTTSSLLQASSVTSNSS